MIDFAPHQVTNPAPLVNDFGSHLANWLGSVGYRIPDPKVGYSFGLERDDVGAVSSRDRGIIFNPEMERRVWNLSSRYGQRGRLDEEHLGTLRLMLHELMHQPLMHREPEWYGAASNEDRLWEEAAAEQAAADLLPAAARQLFGSVIPAEPKKPLKLRVRRPKQEPPPTERTQRERAYQQLSVFGSGAKTYRDRPARQWRRQFQTSDTATRARMRAEAEARRGVR
jgi:hypothetical protein